MSWFLHAIAFACLASGLALGLGALAETHHALLLWRSKRTKAADLKGVVGIVDIRGQARAETPMTAPLTGRACVQFTVVMERAQPTSGQKRDGDSDLITFVGGQRFVVDDKSGTVDIDLTTDNVPVSGASVVRQPLERLTAPLERMLAARLGKPGGLWCMNRNVTATEAAILDGTEVSVVARRRATGEFDPLHIMTGRAKVIALQGSMRATGALAGCVIFFSLWNWLR